jgi:nitrous oxidase accessory protein
MRLILLALSALPALAGAGEALAADPLQRWVDATPSGGVLVLPPGIYAGPVTIGKPITIDGSARQATVDGGGTGTVIVIQAEGVTLRNLVIQGSGASHDTVDSAIAVNASRAAIQGNVIRDTLFGIDLKESHDSRIEGNDISSKPYDLGLRGDGIRLWASHRNLIRGNRLHDSRDLVVWYSNGNRIVGNKAWNNRYSVHFMYGEQNDVEDNEFLHSSVGIYLMYSKTTRVRGNHVFNSLGAGGVGIGLKESDDIVVSGNSIVYCATGIYADQSPQDDRAVNRIEGNEIAYNAAGIVFHSELLGNELRDNRLFGNMVAVTVEGNGSARENLWEGNYWSDYEGFDRDGDNVGDTPFEERHYIDQLWAGNPVIKFFYGSPVLTFLDYLARFAPLSEPKLILADRKPIFARPTPLPAALRRSPTTAQ